MVERASACDEQAMESLLLTVRLDLTRVLAANLNNPRLLDEALQDVNVRLFVYLHAGRFNVPADAKDATCLEYLRRWATNTARNWARLVNRYGLVTSQGRYTLPQWAYEPEARHPRRAIFPYELVDDRQPFDGESSEELMDRLAQQSVAHYGTARVIR